ncbi:hypothetical protein L873DRAFT_552105 [Choiromyces venosus 120613-1]|uniref:Uncharacterized protein n=1 Tax=Choiromyces venosus 120613-1 TaxID=1336337 RepID=A0A3N4KJ19_9PEZI|nr:hypothetical protein L873DRAFT_552105 [Choiromyces venosus 120613-1]
MSGTGASSGSFNPGSLASHLNFPGLDRINIRRRLALQDQLDNDADEVVYMDEEEQDRLIKQLKYEDSDKNIFFTKLIFLLEIVQLPMFFFRLWTAPNWLDFFSIISIIISSVCVPTTQKFEDRSELALEPGWVPAGARMNLVLATAIGVMTLFKHYMPSEDVKVTLHMNAYENMGLIPLVLWVFSHFTRKALRAVDTCSLEELRYRYLGA